MIHNMICGGKPLNFKLVGNPQPEAPRENTLWLDTDVPVTGWFFSAAEPEAPGEGTVWIVTGGNRVVEFNALKKHGIMVYPAAAKQYTGGAWVDKTAKLYQNGEWVSWELYLYSYGKSFGHVTGGYTVVASDSDSFCTAQEQGLYLYCDTFAAVHVIFNNRIDLRAVSALELYFDGLSTAYDGTTVTLRVASNKISTAEDAIDTLASTAQSGNAVTAKKLTLDVSALDSGYVYITFATSGNYNKGSVVIREVKEGAR